MQSWHAWVCVYFCSQECPEPEPAFVDSSVVLEDLPGGTNSSVVLEDLPGGTSGG